MRIDISDADYDAPLPAPREGWEIIAEGENFDDRSLVANASIVGGPPATYRELMAGQEMEFEDQHVLTREAWYDDRRTGVLGDRLVVRDANGNLVNSLFLWSPVESPPAG